MNAEDLIKMGDLRAQLGALAYVLHKSNEPQTHPVFPAYVQVLMQISELRLDVYARATTEVVSPDGRDGSL